MEVKGHETGIETESVSPILILVKAEENPPPPSSGDWIQDKPNAAGLDRG